MSDQIPMLTGMREAFRNGDIHVVSTPRRKPARDGLCHGDAHGNLLQNALGGAGIGFDSVCDERLPRSSLLPSHPTRHPSIRSVGQACPSSFSSSRICSQ